MDNSSHSARLTIGQVASRCGVRVETVRSYERQGLLIKPMRTPSGHRRYGEEAIIRLRFIERAKELGFTLNEIKMLLSLRADGVATRRDVRSRAKARLGDIEDKIRDLQLFKQTLLKLSSAYGEAGSDSTCSLIDALMSAPGKDTVPIKSKPSSSRG